ncbi:hypothetical protein [Spongiibacter marinus]|uniref:hypothetical protein n=1 Tax=Spongiibacter marinus TaxID=354246 RepID=UPI0003FDDF9D|nr:hypothetical protein [Spongiibacter marinus]
MKNTMTLSSALIIATLTACGGGGGGGSSAASETPSASSPSSAAPTGTTPSGDSSNEIANATPSEAATTSELIVPTGFDLEQDYQLTISAHAADFGSENAYLSVCSNFSEANGSYDVDYSSCIMKATLSPQIERTLQIPNDVETLVAVVFALNGDNEPAFSQWQRSGDSEEYWHVR